MFSLFLLTDPRLFFLLCPFVEKFSMKTVEESAREISVFTVAEFLLVARDRHKLHFKHQSLNENKNESVQHYPNNNLDSGEDRTHTHTHKTKHNKTKIELRSPWKNIVNKKKKRKKRRRKEGRLLSV